MEWAILNGNAILCMSDILSSPQKCLCVLWVIALLIAAGIAAVFLTVFAVRAIGFGVAGIMAGTTAAGLMAAYAPTIAGGVVATLQSIGAIGCSATLALSFGGLVSFIMAIPMAYWDICDVYSSTEGCSGNI
jgi:presenilin-like A22 family membrane protease